MKDIRIFLVVLVILVALLVALYMIDKRQEKKEKKNDLDSLSKELYEITLKLQGAKCKSAVTDDIIQRGRAIDLQAKNMILDKNDPPTPTSIDNYRQIAQQFGDAIKMIDGLPDCSIYCSQGTYDASKNTCVCPDANPVPVEYNGNVYCAKEDCATIPHTSFVPGKSADENKCACVDGYINDPTNPTVYCYNQNKTNALNDYYNQIKGFNDQLNNLPGINVSGTYKGFTINPQTDLQTPNVIKQVDNVMSTFQCGDACAADNNCKAFAFDGNQQSCYMYSNNSPTASNNTRTFGYRS